MTDRQKALEWFKNRRTAVMMSASKKMYNEAVKALEELEKRGEGKWENDEHDMPRCSHCGYMPEYNRFIDDYYYSDYCPNCGAKMTEDGA